MSNTFSLPYPAAASVLMNNGLNAFLIYTCTTRITPINYAVALALAEQGSDQSYIQRQTPYIMDTCQYNLMPGWHDMTRHDTHKRLTH